MITVLSRKDVVEDRYLRMCDTEDVRAVIALIKEKKSMVGRGFSKDKEMRAIGDIPVRIYNHPAFRHVFHNQNTGDSEELRKRFLNERTAFRLVDRI